MHDICIAEVSNMINNLSDIILWKAMGLPVMDWMLDRITLVFDNIVNTCFVTETIDNGTRAA